jgi:hypothetical protein
MSAIPFRLSSIVNLNTIYAASGKRSDPRFHPILDWIIDIAFISIGCGKGSRWRK